MFDSIQFDENVAEQTNKTKKLKNNKIRRGKL